MVARSPYSATQTDPPGSYRDAIDWSIFHALNGLLRGDDAAQDVAELYNSWAIFALVAVAAATWFLARPGGSLRSKLAAASAGIAAVVALMANAVLGHVNGISQWPQQNIVIVPMALATGVAAVFIKKAWVQGAVLALQIGGWIWYFVALQTALSG